MYQFQGKGAGLGLAIVRGMIEAHGGMIWVESREPHSPAPGSCFSLLLPLEPPQRQPHLPFLRSDGDPSALPAGQPEPGEG